jgi:hypothetical protein
MRLFFLEVLVQPNEQFTKDYGRHLLQRLAERRQSQTPGRKDPEWMTAYWERIGVLP